MAGATAKARATGLEPATSGVTGRRSNQLNYARWQWIRVAEGRYPVRPCFRRDSRLLYTP